jgi:hypothetical protein
MVELTRVSRRYRLRPASRMADRSVRLAGGPASAALLCEQPGFPFGDGQYEHVAYSVLPIFSAWKAEAQARWRLGAGTDGSTHVSPTKSLRALRRLRRRLPRSIRPRRRRLKQLCWEAVLLHEHGTWVTRDVNWLLQPEHNLSVEQVPVMLEVSIRIVTEPR